MLFRSRAREAAGFVAGSLTSAALGLADRLNPRHCFLASAVIAAAADFFDSLRPDQQQELRETMDRLRRWGRS